MNTKHLLTAAAAVALFSACSDYDPGLSGEAQPYTDKEVDLLEEYSKNFEERYGTIAENHTFGFGDQGSVDEGTRASNPNSNLWLEYTKGKVLDTEGQEYDGIVDIQVKEGVVVPGFPVVNNYSSYQGYYHVYFTGESKDQWFPTKEDMIEYMRQNKYTEVIPMGDVTNPNTLTDNEVAAVKAEFDKQKPGYVSVSDIDYSSYYVQQIWHGNAVHSGTTQGGDVVEVVGGDKVDYLCAEGNDHFYNFNNSDFSNGQGGMMLIYDSNTHKFGYHNSYDNTDYYDNFRLVELNGNYYVGFDFESNGADEKKVERDYIFNDWIVKIIPGNGGSKVNWHRVMCEDLGNTYDFDFNDLVFDVYFSGTAGNYVANIRVQAAGGTLPIYIGYDKNESYEAHKLLGQVVTNVPVNVGQGVSAPYKDIQIPMSAFDKANSTNADYIPIYVGKSSAEGSKTTTLLPSIGTDLTAAPQKICIPDNTTKWTKEHRQFGSGTSSYAGKYKVGAYSFFTEWIQNPTGAYGFSGATPWNKNGIDNTLLFSK